MDAYQSVLVLYFVINFYFYFDFQFLMQFRCFLVSSVFSFYCLKCLVVAEFLSVCWNELFIIQTSFAILKETWSIFS